MKKSFRELKNWFYIKRTIREEKRKPNSMWNTYKLRNNWFGRIYTVLSLREEDLGEELVIQNWKAMEMMRPINEYLTSLDFTEIVFPSIERIPNSRSYLVVYSPLFKHLTAWKVTLTILAVSSLIFGILYVLL